MSTRAAQAGTREICLGRGWPTHKESMKHTTLLNLCLASLAVVALVVACTAPQAEASTSSQASPEERTARLPEAATAAVTAPMTDATPSKPEATSAPADLTQPLSVTILNTNDVHGKTDPCG